MPKLKIYSRYDVPKIPGILFPEPTLTQQHFADEVDINKIVERAIKTNDHTIFTPTERGQYFDASAYTDYQTSLDYLATVEEDFYGLPARVRKEFQNDPDKYVAFMTDPANIDKAIEMGLLQGSEDKVNRAPSDLPQASDQPAASAPEGDSPKGKKTNSDA